MAVFPCDWDIVVVVQDLRDAFYSFGELRSIRIVPGKDFAFVQFTTRQAAEAAAEALFKVKRFDVNPPLFVSPS